MKRRFATRKYTSNKFSSRRFAGDRSVIIELFNIIFNISLKTKLLHTFRQKVIYDDTY